MPLAPNTEVIFREGGKVTVVVPLPGHPLYGKYPWISVGATSDSRAAETMRKHLTYDLDI